MKKHLLWIVELFIWLLILFLISGVIILVKYNYKKNLNTYQIFLPDVDGLINGSPVKLMGINIGYVNQINIVGEDVYVKFIITNSDVKIPHGSSATVEFSGLGGSKSLELYPPEAKKNLPDKLLNPQSPKRIHDSIGLLNDMFNQFIDIAYNVSRFMDKVGIIGQSNEFNDKNAQSINKFLDYSNNLLDKYQKQTDKFYSKINGENHEQK